MDKILDSVGKVEFWALMLKNMYEFGKLGSVLSSLLWERRKSVCIE